MEAAASPDTAKVPSKKEQAVGLLVLKQMAAGSLARATAGTLLIPVDTCKTRLQFQGSMAQGDVKQYRGFIDCFGKIYTEEGIRAFYRGTRLHFPLIWQRQDHRSLALTHPPALNGSHSPPLVCLTSHLFLTSE